MGEGGGFREGERAFRKRCWTGLKGRVVFCFTKGRTPYPLTTHPCFVCMRATAACVNKSCASVFSVARRCRSPSSTRGAFAALPAASATEFQARYLHLEPNFESSNLKSQVFQPHKRSYGLIPLIPTPATRRRRRRPRRRCPLSPAPSRSATGGSKGLGKRSYLTRRSKKRSLGSAVLFVRCARGASGSSACGARTGPPAGRAPRRIECPFCCCFPMSKGPLCERAIPLKKKERKWPRGVPKKQRGAWRCF